MTTRISAPRGRGRGRARGRGSSSSKAPAGQPLMKFGSSKPAPALQAESARWWSVLEDEDPISLEPLCRLPYPPFRLPTLEGQKPAKNPAQESNAW